MEKIKNLKLKYTQQELDQALKRKKELLGLRGNFSHQKLEDVFHHKNTGRYIGDFVYGANDGIITTFAVVTGAIGASLSPLVIIILGFANLIADGFSMGASSFLSITSDQDYKKSQRHKEEWEIKNLTELEVQEVRDIYSDLGFTGMNLEDAVEMTINDPKKWVDLMMIYELGILEDENEVAWKHGLATFAAFVLVGLAPLIPFLLPIFAENKMLFSPIFAAVALFISGALRTFITVKSWWAGGLEMLFVGGVAGGVSFGVGLLLKTLLGVS